MKDIKDIDYNKCTNDEWKRVVKAINTYEEVEIHESIYYYFLGVLPPRKFIKQGFLFSEGWDEVKEFKFHKADNKYTCRTIQGLVYKD